MPRRNGERNLDPEKSYFPHVLWDNQRKLLKEEEEFQKYEEVKLKQDERDRRSLLPGILDPDRQLKYKERR